MVHVFYSAKTVPLELPEDSKKENNIDKEEKKNREGEKKASTSLTRAKMLEMAAWYLIPVIYIIFTIIYFTIYSMF